MRAGDRSRSSYVAGCLVGILLAPNATGAQLVMPRTVPVQQSGQLDVFPSQHASMAGVSIAVDDTLMDPFVNPATATRLRGARLFAEFGHHRVTRGGGGGRTIPLGALGSRGPWSAGALVAFQTLDDDAVLNGRALGDKPDNRYASVALARRLPGGFSIGASTFNARLEALDGMHALYSGSDSIAVSGDVDDIRAGITKSWRSGKTLEIIALQNRTAIRHDVTFPIGAWDPKTGRFSTTTQQEQHDDRRRVAGAHAEFAARVSDSARFGVLATVNRLTHERFPNYRFSNLPRDPGTTYAYNLGFGASKFSERSSFALDAIYEPMFSHTWAEAGPNATDSAGAPLAPDTKTVENRFRFANLKARAGLSTQVRIGADTAMSFDIGLGLFYNRNSYHVRRQNNLTGEVSSQNVEWVEWGPSFGLRVRARDLEVSYRGRLSCAPGACSPTLNSGFIDPGPDIPDGAPIPAPILAQHYGHVFVQRVSIIVPIGGW